MPTISECMRKAAGYNGAQAGERQALLRRGADTIDALVAALLAAREAIPGDDYFKVRPKIDAALALARKGG